jgi:hypothetical protein
MPNIDKAIIKENVKNIRHTLFKLYKKCIVTHNIEICNGVRINKLLIFDNNYKDMKLIYDNNELIKVDKFKEIINDASK